MWKIEPEGDPGDIDRSIRCDVDRARALLAGSPCEVPDQATVSVELRQENVAVPVVSENHDAIVRSDRDVDAGFFSTIFRLRRGSIGAPPQEAALCAVFQEKRVAVPFAEAARLARHVHAAIGGDGHAIRAVPFPAAPGAFRQKHVGEEWNLHEDQNRAQHDRLPH